MNINLDCPQYHYGNIHLYNCDCMELMKQIPDKEIDLAIVDPPYGIGNWVQITGDLRRDANPVDWNEESHRPNQGYFDELKRISKERIIWGANYYNCFEGGMGAIVWDKQNPNPKFSNVEIASYSKHKRVAKIEIPYYGFIGEDKNFHPCAKPIQLYKWLLKNYSKPEHSIIDTHGGSFSSAIACYDFGTSEFIGCEIDADYFKAAVNRIKIHVSQQKLF